MGRPKRNRTQIYIYIFMAIFFPFAAHPASHPKLNLDMSSSENPDLTQTDTAPGQKGQFGSPAYDIVSTNSPP